MQSCGRYMVNRCHLQCALPQKRVPDPLPGAEAPTTPGRESMLRFAIPKNLFTAPTGFRLLRSAGNPRAVLAMLTYPQYGALVLASPWAAPLRHGSPAFARDGSW